MDRTFRAQKMLDRVKAQGKEDLLTPEIVDKIKSMDGMVGNDYNWASVTRGEPLVYLTKAKEYVALCDCE